MSRARLQKDQSIPVWASEYNKDKQGEVVCFFCRCRVKGVRAYSRNVGDKQITVAAYFSLWKQVEHANFCRYNVEKTIKRFVAYSKSIRKVVPDAVPILDKIGQGQAAEFRLHILMEALQKQTYGFRPACPRIKWVPTDTEDSTGTDYVRTSKVLKPYFRTAKGVLSLAARLQSSEDLAAWISLKFGDQRISWDEFFYDVDEYEALYKQLAIGKESRRNSRSIRPIAIVAEVSKMAGVIQTSGEYRLVGSARVIRTEGRKLAVRPVFYFRDADLAYQKANDDFLLVCGIPRLGEVKQPPATAPQLNPRVDVSIKVVDARQVCQYVLK